MCPSGRTHLPRMVYCLGLVGWLAVGSGGRGPGDRIVAAMSSGLPAPHVPVTTVAGVIARMEAIEAALSATDGLACFDRMYLQVTRQINSRLGQGFSPIPRS